MIKTFSLLVAVAFMGSFGLMRVGFADIVAANETASSELAATIDASAKVATPEAVASNVSLFNNKLSEISAKIAEKKQALAAMAPADSGREELESEIAQLNSVADALKVIIGKVQAGYVVSDYAVSTDAADGHVTAKLSFSKGGETPVTQAAAIPPVATSPFVNPLAQTPMTADPLTTALNQIAQQFTGMQAQNPMAAVTNPLANVQSTVAGMVANNGVQPLVPSTANAACTPNGQKPGNGVAIYDISAGKVYMPDGSVLEAHSGLGANMDNPNSVNIPNQGATPPGTYSLSLREQSFHGVQAIRLNAVAGTPQYGRDGFLAHTPMLKRFNTLGSNGCVAFPNYNQFLAAFQAGQVTQLVVVPKMADAATGGCDPVAYEKDSPESKAMKDKEAAAAK